MEKDVGKVTRLVKRGNVYCYRTRIPKDVQDTFPGRAEIWISLNTSDYSQAAPLAKIEAGKWNAAFLEAHNQLQPVANPVSPKKSRSLTKEDAERLARLTMQTTYSKDSISLATPDKLYVNQYIVQ